MELALMQLCSLDGTCGVIPPVVIIQDLSFCSCHKTRSWAKNRMAANNECGYLVKHSELLKSMKNFVVDLFQSWF